MCHSFHDDAVNNDVEPQLLCDFLLEIGACAAWMTDADRGTRREEAIFSEPVSNNNNNIDDDDDAIHSLIVWAAPIWNRCNVTALFPASVHIPSTLQQARDVFPDCAFARYSDQDYIVEQVPNQDWVILVQQSWKPIVKANKFVFCFPWHGESDVQAAIQAHVDHAPHRKEGVDDLDGRHYIPIQLQGGVAFGTGEHATTELCLEWLESVVTRKLADATNRDLLTVLDYGSGSGILGLAACALDSQNRVTAIGVDIDVDACRIANRNSVVNQLPMRSFLPPMTPLFDDSNMDTTSKSLLFKAHRYALEQQQVNAQTDRDDNSMVSVLSRDNFQPCHLAVANIMATPLISLASTLYPMLQPGASIGMSGILSHQGEMVVQAYQAAGYVNVGIAKELDGWLLVTAQRPE
jgi:ribosomal protein L11 methyltransferase